MSFYFSRISYHKNHLLVEFGHLREAA